MLGNVPVSWLSLMCNLSKDVIDPIVLGMGPDSKLYDKNKYCNLVKDPIVRGKVPIKLLYSKLSRKRLVNDPIILGNVPDRSFLSNSIVIMDVIDPIV